MFRLLCLNCSNIVVGRNVDAVGVFAYHLKIGIVALTVKIFVPLGIVVKNAN